MLPTAAMAAAAPAPSAPVPAQSPARIQAAAALPNWSGAWTSVQPDVFDAKTGAAVERARPPYRKDWEAKYVETMAKLKTNPKLDPLSECMPLGLLRMMSIAGDFEFAVTPETTFVFSSTAPGPQSTGLLSRRIYTDGRPQLTGDDLFPTYTGNSIGHWEGDTLVVRTVGLNDSNFIDRTGAQLSADAVVSERIRLISADTLEDRFTIEDKTALTKPWTVVRTYKRSAEPRNLAVDSCLGKRVNPANLTDAAVARRNSTNNRGAR